MSDSEALLSLRQRIASAATSARRIGVDNDASGDYGSGDADLADDIARDMAYRWDE